MRQPFSLKPPRIVPKGAGLIATRTGFRTDWSRELALTAARKAKHTRDRECTRRICQKHHGASP